MLYKALFELPASSPISQIMRRIVRNLINSGYMSVDYHMIVDGTHIYILDVTSCSHNNCADYTFRVITDGRYVTVTRYDCQEFTRLRYIEYACIGGVIITPIETRFSVELPLNLPTQRVVSALRYHTDVAMYNISYTPLAVVKFFEERPSPSEMKYEVSGEIDIKFLGTLRYRVLSPTESPAIVGYVPVIPIRLELVNSNGEVTSWVEFYDVLDYYDYIILKLIEARVATELVYASYFKSVYKKLMSDRFSELLL